MIAQLLDNRYKILQTLGKGGFGETYLATDTRMPSGKKCVIKLLKPVAETDEQQKWIEERFEREATILEQLGETNQQIPRLYAYFCETGKYYLVQQWIEGLTLTQKLQQEGKLAEAEVKKILKDILPVLTYIHGKKIVHRDIKPDNIILRSQDDKPVLIDFGAVKEAMATEADGSRSVLLSMAIGTPGYMPSEQAAGRPLYSSDIYSLGLTAVYLLTGKIPQDLETNPDNGEIIWQKHRSIFDRNLARVIEQAIRFHPRDRFTSAEEMLAALVDSNTDKVTVATVAVAPQIASQPKPKPERLPNTPTIATNAVAMQSPLTSAPIKLALPLLFFTTIGLGSFLLASNLLNSPQKPNQIAETETKNPSPPKEEVEVVLGPTKEPQISKPEETIDREAHKDISKVIDPDLKLSEESLIDPIAPEPSRPNLETKNYPLERVPIFRTGVDKDRIIAALGEPTRDLKGYFSGTRAMYYTDFVPDRVHLGYVYDNNTRRLLQTEVSFDRSSVDLKIMEKTLKDLLRGRISKSVEEALQEVYYGKTDLRSFQVGIYQGTIKQEGRGDRIYIGVWDRNFKK